MTVKLQSSGFGGGGVIVKHDGGCPHDSRHEGQRTRPLKVLTRSSENRWRNIFDVDFGKQSSSPSGGPETISAGRRDAACGAAGTGTGRRPELPARTAAGRHPTDSRRAARARSDLR